MTLQSRILNRYRFIWAFWLTFQIYSLNAKFSFSVTAIPHSYHGVLALSIYHFSCSLMQMGKSQQEWWKVHRHLLLSKNKKKKSIYFIATGPPALWSSEIIGDVRLYMVQHNTMSKQPALRTITLGKRDWKPPRKDHSEEIEGSHAHTKHISTSDRLQVVTISLTASQELPKQ